MAITPTITTPYMSVPVRVGMHGGLGLLTGLLTTAGTYAASGFAFDLSEWFAATPYDVSFSKVPGYGLEYDYNSAIASGKVLAYRGAAGTTGAGESHDHVFAGSALGTHQHNAGGTGASGAPNASAAAGYLLYQVREDPSGADLTIVGGHAAHSANPREWDISSICGANAKAVKIRVVLGDDHADTWVKFYQKGEGVGYEDVWAWWNPDNHNTEEAFDITIEPDSSGIIYYHVNNGAGAGNIVHLSATVLGWYEQVTLPSGIHTHTGPSHQHAAITAGTPAGDNAAEATHTHAVSAGALAEVTAGVALVMTDVRWYAFGRVAI